MEDMVSEQAFDSTLYSKVLVSFILVLESLGRSIQTISSPKGGRLAELGRDRATLELCRRAVVQRIQPGETVTKLPETKFTWTSTYLLFTSR